MGPDELGRRVGRPQRVEGQHVHRRLEMPEPGRAVPLEQLQDPPVELVGAGHVAVDDPVHVARDAGHAVEVRGAELHAEQVLAFGRAGRRSGSGATRMRGKASYMAPGPWWRPRCAGRRARCRPREGAPGRTTPTTGPTGSGGRRPAGCSSAVVPVRGRPMMTSGPSTSSSSMSGLASTVDRTRSRLASSIPSRGPRMLRAPSR